MRNYLFRFCVCSLPVNNKFPVTQFINRGFISVCNRWILVPFVPNFLFLSEVETTNVVANLAKCLNLYKSSCSNMCPNGVRWTQTQVFEAQMAM